MIVTKGISFISIISWTMHHLVWLFLVMGSIAALYYFKIINVHIPWLPVSVVGMAVAFYVGFKNNQAYDRMWEARKIWGGIVNESRSWGMMIDGFISNQFTKAKMNQKETQDIKERFASIHLS